MEPYIFDDRKEQAGDYLAGLGIGRNDLTPQERERAIKQIDDGLKQIDDGLTSWKTPFEIQIKDIVLIVEDVPDELAHLRHALA